MVDRPAGTVLDRGLGSWPARRRRIAGDRPALRFEGETWTYAQLDDRVRKLGRALLALRVRRGDRVSYLGPNHPAFLETLFATAAIGAVFVPVNPRLAVEDIAFVLGDAGVDVVVHHPALAATVAGLRAGPSPRTWIALERAAADADGADPDYEQVVAAQQARPLDIPVDLEELCLLPYTSGTTGQPKGVMLTHANLTANVHNFLSIADFSGRDVTLAFAPLFRVGGLAVTVLPTLWKGGCVLLMPGPDPDRVLELIASERVTTMFAAPDLLASLTRSPRWPDADLSSLRFCLTGGAPVPEPLIRTYLDRGVTFLQGYGLTEASPLALLLDPADMLRKVGSAGRAPFYTDVRVVRPDMTDSIPGEVGEIVVHGPNVMRGYWNQPEATDAALTDGWLHTGDAATMDEDGFVTVIDRLKDRFVVGGEFVYPGQIERVLREHPAVADVAVVGFDDLTLGPAPAALVVRNGPLNGADLVAWAAERLAPVNVPRRIEFADDLPRNPVGKVLKHRVRELLTPAT